MRKRIVLAALILLDAVLYPLRSNKTWFSGKGYGVEWK